jgi:hypothetical protein
MGRECKTNLEIAVGRVKENRIRGQHDVLLIKTTLVIGNIKIFLKDNLSDSL